MPAAKGTRPPNAGKGRKAGTPNKVNALLKDMILQALSDAGGTLYLTTQAATNPNAFMALIGRVLPMQVKEGGDDPRVPATTVNHIHESDAH